MKINKIAVIGAGNMGSALITGLQNTNILKDGQLHVYDKDQSKTAALKDKKTVISENIKDAVKDAEIIFLLVKPQHLSTLFDDLTGKLNKNQSLVIIAAGKSIADVPEKLKKDNPVFLAMPNTAISVNQSLTCIATTSKDKESKKTVFDVFNQLGSAIEVEEQLMGAATVQAACGTAFALRYMRASALAGIEMGMEPEEATRIAAQIVKGAAELTLKNQVHPEQEIDKVVTPKGITISGLNEMEHNGFSAAVIKGMIHAFKKVEGWMR